MTQHKLSDGMLILALAISCFASSLTIRVTDPLVPILARELGTSEPAMSQATAAFLVPYALGQIPLGIMGDRLGKIRLIKWSLVALTIFTGLLPLAQSIEAFMSLRAVAGFASAAIVPMSLAVIGDVKPLEQRPAAISRAVMGILSGMLIGVAGGAKMAATMGTSTTFLAAAALCACAWLVLTGRNAFAVAAKVPIAHSVTNDIGAIFSHPLCLIAYAGVFLDGACVFGFTPFLASQLKAAGNGNSEEAGILIAALAAGGILFTIAANVSSSFSKPARMSVWGGILCANALCVIASQRSIASLLMAFAVLGFGFYMLHNVLQTIATQLSVEARGAAVSLHAFFFFLGQAAGPFLFAYAFTNIGIGKSFLIAATVLVCLGFAVHRKLVETPGRT